MNSQTLRVLSSIAALGVASFAFSADVVGWNCANGGPPGRGAQGMGFDVRNHTIVMFGGLDGTLPLLDDTWIYDGNQWSEASKGKPGPSARTNVGLAYDSVGGKLLLFGGGGDNGVSPGDTWAWDGDVWEQLFPATSPSPRSALIVSDPDRGRVVAWGGADTGFGPIDCDGGDCRDTWEWNGTTWTQVATDGPPARRSHALAYLGGSKILLFGGIGEERVYGDTWVFDGLTSTWTELHPGVSPEPRGGHVMMYESNTGKVLLFGGGPGGQLNDTWEFFNGEWREVFPPDVPLGRENFAGAYDAARGEAVFFGGKVGALYTNDQTCKLTPRACRLFPCAGDFNGDCVVDGADLGLLLGSWGVCPTS